MIRAVVTFDVHSNKTNKDITKLLKTYGYRVQKSVYEIQIYKSDLDKLSQEIQSILNLDTDSCMIYNLGKDNKDNVRRLGVTNNIYPDILDNGYIII